jgi:thioredoxin-related protein
MDISMPRIFFFTLLLISYTLCYGAPSHIQWKTYSPQSVEQAKNAHKPLILLGTSPICEWCKKMEATTWQDSAVLQLINEKYIAVEMNVDDNATAADQYQMNDLPTIILFNNQGKQIKFFGGYVSAKELLTALQETLSSNK